MEIKINIVTTDQDYRDCLYIRNKVFIEEQNINKKLEYDDKKVSAIYIVAKINLIAIGTARYRSTEIGMKLERFAVLKEYRGLGVGKSLVFYVISFRGCRVHRNQVKCTQNVPHAHPRRHARRPAAARDRPSRGSAWCPIDESPR